MTDRISVTITADTRPAFAQAVEEEIAAMTARGMVLAKITAPFIDSKYRADMEFAQR